MTKSIDVAAWWWDGDDFYVEDTDGRVTRFINARIVSVEEREDLPWVVSIPITDGRFEYRP